MILVRLSPNLVLTFTFSCPTCVPNFSSIELCVPELEQFLWLCEKKNKKKKTKKKKAETLVTCILEMVSMIYFKFGFYNV